MRTKLIPISLLLLLFLSSVSALQQLLSLQGKVDYNGVLVRSGNLTVTIHDAATGGNLIYNSTRDFDLAIVDGYFDVMLGSARNLSLENNKVYYLDLAVNGTDLNWGADARKQFLSPVGTNFTGDTNFSVGTNNLFVDNANGRIGIGGISPQAKLHINATNSTGGRLGDIADALRITNASGQEYFFINGTTGNVGIGTTSPTKNLHVIDNNGIVGYGYPAIFEGASGLGNAYVTIKATNQAYTWYNTTGSDKSSWVVGSETDGTNNTFRISTLNSGFVGDRSAKLVIGVNGNVGIKQTDPSAELEVVGRIYANSHLNAIAYYMQGTQYAGAIMPLSTANTWALGFSTGSTNNVSVLSWNANSNVGINTTSQTVALGITGQGLATKGFSTGGPDIAETIKVSDLTIEPGDILVTNNEKSVTAKKSRKPYDNNVIGVVSTEPGYVMYPMEGMSQNRTVRKDERLLTLAGRVPVKVSTENGPIKIGDYITSSSMQGTGMAATEPGKVVGIALEPFNWSNATQCGSYKCGKILVLVNIGEGNIIEAVKEQQNQINQLKTENDMLKAENNEINSRLAALEGK